MIESSTPFLIFTTLLGIRRGFFVGNPISRKNPNLMGFYYKKVLGPSPKKPEIFTNTKRILKKITKILKIKNVKIEITPKILKIEKIEIEIFPFYQLLIKSSKESPGFL